LPRALSLSFDARQIRSWARASRFNSLVFGPISDRQDEALAPWRAAAGAASLFEPSCFQQRAASLRAPSLRAPSLRAPREALGSSCPFGRVLRARVPARADLPPNGGRGFHPL